MNIPKIGIQYIQNPMEIRRTGLPFSGSERLYFEWSNQIPPPDVWQNVEKPAMAEGISEAVTQLGGLDIRVLDVGVGGGKILGLTRDLGIRDRNLVGIDINSRMLELVSNLYPGIDLREADISNPSVLHDLSDKSPFQLITAHMVLNHLDDDQLSLALSNIFDLLSDRGFFVGLVPYPDNPAKLDDLKDSAYGYYSLENAPWGGTVIYRHRSFVAYHEYLELSGFYPHLTAYETGTLSYPNRLLLIGRKSDIFKNSLKDEGLDTSEIDRHNYLPNKHLQISVLFS